MWIRLIAEEEFHPVGERMEFSIKLTQLAIHRKKVKLDFVCVTHKRNINFQID